MSSKNPFEKIFGEFRKDLEKYTKDTPKIFEKTAKKGAIEFVNQAKDITDREKLVDTGNYKRNWFAESINTNYNNIVYCENSVDYASHLEWGHKLRSGKRVKGKFVGEQAINEAQLHCVHLLQKTLDKLIK